MPDFSRPLLGAVAVLGIGAACLSAPSAEAAGRSQYKAGRHHAKVARAKPAKVVRAEKPMPDAKSAALKTTSVEPAGVWTSGEQDRACFRGRRKLWQPGEGWVVKKVNLCP